MDDFAKPSETGLVMDAGGDLIYYMSITAQLLSKNPTHDGRGVSVSFLDGHAKFYSVHMQDVINFNATSTKTDDYSWDIPWVHKAFWGRHIDGSYAPFSTNYPPYAP
jgi:prepilin-type processing-associated H-X9-DG protein